MTGIAGLLLSFLQLIWANITRLKIAFWMVGGIVYTVITLVFELFQNRHPRARPGDPLFKRLWILRFRGV